MSIVGDIGSITKNLLRFAGWMEGEPNWTEVLLSGAGLLTEFAVGGGEALDVPISILRAVVAAAGNNGMTRALYYTLKQAIGGGDLGPITAVAKGFTREGTLVTKIVDVLDSPEFVSRLGKAGINWARKPLRTCSAPSTVWRTRVARPTPRRCVRCWVRRRCRPMSCRRSTPCPRRLNQRGAGPAQAYESTTPEQGIPRDPSTARWIDA